MKTVRRLIYRDVVWSTVFVGVAFLSLFFFIDFLDELGDVGRAGFTIMYAAASAALELPGRLYELMPIAVLIGTIYAMARLAQSSEFTILRTAGLGPTRALGLLITLGVAMSALTFLIGEYAAPLGEQTISSLKNSVRGGNRIGGSTGAWLKERRDQGGEPLGITIRVGGTTADGSLSNLSIYEHDATGREVMRIDAETGHLQAASPETVRDTGLKSVLLLDRATITRWPPTTEASTDGVQVRNLEHLTWPTSLDRNLVMAAISSIDTMSTTELWEYTQHLKDQSQSSQRYELEFWKRALYPFACLVMVVLALPFAYLHARSGGISLKVFGGVMLGISFVLLNNVVGHIGMLRDWTPWVAAAVPSALFLALSLGAFAWLVRYH